MTVSCVGGAGNVLTRDTRRRLVFVNGTTEVNGLVVRRLVVLAVVAAAIVAGFFAELPEKQPPTSADGRPMGSGAMVRTEDGGFVPFAERQMNNNGNSKNGMHAVRNQALLMRRFLQISKRIEKGRLDSHAAACLVALAAMQNLSQAQGVYWDEAAVENMLGISGPEQRIALAQLESRGEIVKKDGYFCVAWDVE